MSALPPNICTELATISYSIKKVDRFSRLGISNTLESYFNFNINNDVIKGISGGDIAHAKGIQTGFVLVGKGSSAIGRLILTNMIWSLLFVVPIQFMTPHLNLALMCIADLIAYLTP